MREIFDEMMANLKRGDVATANMDKFDPSTWETDVKGVGYGEADIPALTEGAYPQRRLMENAPCDISKDALSGLFTDALSYW